MSLVQQPFSSWMVATTHMACAAHLVVKPTGRLPKNSIWVYRNQPRDQRYEREQWYLQTWCVPKTFEQTYYKIRYPNPSRTLLADILQRESLFDVDGCFQLAMHTTTVHKYAIVLMDSGAEWMVKPLPASRVLHILLVVLLLECAT